MNNTNTATTVRKKRIVILGGGMASLTAAFELTSQPNWCDRFDVTVYQVGWRLGGKGASGRNAEMSYRIEEHGLHVWPGFYDNAFRLIRRCFQELARDSSKPLATWDLAFVPQHFITIEELIDGRWIHWPFDAPPKSSLPGDPEPAPTPWNLVLQVLRSMERHFFEAEFRAVMEAPLNTVVIALQWPVVEEVLTGRDPFQHALSLLRNALAFAESLPSNVNEQNAAQRLALLFILDEFAVLFAQ